MKKIGELKGKPIVQGDSNIITTNQILYKESEGKVSLFSREEGKLVPLTASSISSFLTLSGIKQNDIEVVSALNIDDLTFSTPECLIAIGIEPLIKRIELAEYASTFSNGIPVYKVILDSLKNNTLNYNTFINCSFIPDLVYYTRSSDSIKYLINGILNSEQELATGGSETFYIDDLTKAAIRIDKLVYNNSIEDFEHITKYILLFDVEYDN